MRLVYRIIFFLPLLLGSLCYAEKTIALFSNFKINDAELSSVLPEGFAFKSQTSPPKGQKRSKALWKRLLFSHQMPLKGRGDKVVFFNLDRNPYRYYSMKEQKREDVALFMWEPLSVLPHMYTKKRLDFFGCVFTWDDDLVDNRRIFKFYYPVMHPMIEDVVPFKEKKFCTLFASNLSSRSPLALYPERRRAIEFFETKPEGEFEFYGKHWGPEFKAWRGFVDDKIGTLKRYRFCICYENTEEQKGYITEKIFDCFHAGVVPIYLGATNVEEYIPLGCFIDKRNFSSYDELYNFLKSMKEETYQTYLECMRTFLASEMASRFTHDHFAGLITAFVEGKLPISD